jgi:type IV pilus assembly protein PilY1
MFGTKTVSARIGLAVFALFLASLSLPARSQMAQQPLLSTQSPAPLVLLNIGRDEKLFYEAYNDYSDINGDGKIDNGYKPAITYYGYFDSFKCYTYNSSDERFVPASVTSNKKCSGRWSGDFLNYVTTSRIDALRRVLYGGKRSIDTDTDTVLERVFIPQDSHTWGKEYNTTRDSYLISDYTPLSQPNSGNVQHLFASTSLNGDRSRPLLRVLENRSERIWNWIAKEGPVGDSLLDETNATVSPTDYVVRVQVCVVGLLEAECKGYPSNNPTVYKPTGLLHDYGENDAIFFGLMTGSYQNQRSGGVLRKNVSSFKNEVNTATGQFIRPTGRAGIVWTLDQLRIAQWGPKYPAGCAAGNCKDYGSPTAELMYEGLRYFGGGGGATPEFDYTSTGSVDNDIGIRKAAWQDPYRTTTGGFPYCAKPFQMVFSDVYPSYDTDQLPGSAFGSFSAPSLPTQLSGLNVQSIAGTISAAEGISGKYFIGESLDNTPTNDLSPSLKTVTSLGKIRGLAPGEPTRQGGYYAASVARFGRVNDVSATQSAQRVINYSIALSAPLPKLAFKVGQSTVSLIPFAQSVGGGNYGDFQVGVTSPMQNRIVEFFIDKIHNVPGFPQDSSINGGRPSGSFRVSFEDNIEGTDNDMDSIVSYRFEVTASGGLRIDLDSVYNAGSILQHVGFIVSGTTADGAYLGVRDAGVNQPDKPWTSVCVNSPLNDAANSLPPNQCAGGLGLRYSRTFSISSAATVDANIPRDPLFYAAKWGGPGVTEESNFAAATETVVDGFASVPGYFYVNDPAKLRAQLTEAFDNITAAGSPTTTAASTSSFVRPDSGLFLPGYKREKLTAADREPEDTGTVAGPTVWDGVLTAQRFVQSGSTVTLSPWWAVTNASFGTVDLVNKTSSRVVYTKIGTDKTARFLPANLDATLIGRLATASSTPLLASIVDARVGVTASPATKQKETADLVALYLLGDRTYEVRRSGVLRSRRALLGDIVNSSPAFQGPVDEGWGNYSNMAESSTYSAYVRAKGTRKTIYVGANDGMLHAFDAAPSGSVGSERWAFVPEAVQSSLVNLALPSYSHQYFVDGQMTISDVYFGGRWRTVLIAALGAGGKSVFAIDVSDQSNPSVLWEFTHEDLGYSLGRPQIVRLKSGTWAAVFANGYESERTVSAGVKRRVGRLFVLRLSDGQEIGSASTLTVNDSTIVATDAERGLGSPAILAPNGIAQKAWVGDNLGNLWRFDLEATTPKVALSGEPLFTASTGGKRQPITTEPSIVPFPEGGELLLFGTGKFYEFSDTTNTDQQSIYGIWDRSRWTKLTRTNLAAGTITESGGFRYVTGPGVWWGTAANSRGWFMDLPRSGERVVSGVTTVFNTALFSTFISNSGDPCALSKDGTLLGVQPYTALAPDDPIFDINNDNNVNSSDKISGNVPAGVLIGDPVSLVAVNTGRTAVGYDATGTKRVELQGGKATGRRTWRVIQ